MSPNATLGRTRVPVREIPTPEGVPLRFELSLAGDRAGAFLLDAFLVTVIVTGLGIALSFGAALDAEAATSALLLLAFVGRNFYFSGLEILWRGRTIGKRLLGLQVIDRGGHALRVEAILARNLTREVEVFLPLMVVFGGSQIWPTMPVWGRAITLLWALFFAFFPLLNRDRLRLGDLFAGTLVVRSPRPALLPDLAEAGARAGASAPPGEHLFAREHLEAYGIYELQVLEKVLRQKEPDSETVRAVADRIARKVGWEGTVDDPRAFLADFYRAQRAHLEGRLLLGDRREDKAAAAARRPRAGKGRTP